MRFKDRSLNEQEKELIVILNRMIQSRFFNTIQSFVDTENNLIAFNSFERHDLTGALTELCNAGILNSIKINHQNFYIVN